MSVVHQSANIRLAGSDEPLGWAAFKRMCILRWKKGLMDRIISVDGTTALFHTLKAEADSEQEHIARNDPLVGAALKRQAERGDQSRSFPDDGFDSDDDLAWCQEFPRPRKESRAATPRNHEDLLMVKDEFKQIPTPRRPEPTFGSKASSSHQALALREWETEEGLMDELQAPARRSRSRTVRRRERKRSQQAASLSDDEGDEKETQSKQRALEDTPVKFPWLLDIGVKQRDIEKVTKFFLDESIETQEELDEILGCDMDLTSVSAWGKLPLMAQVALKKYFKKATASEEEIWARIQVIMTIGI